MSDLSSLFVFNKSLRQSYDEWQIFLWTAILKKEIKEFGEHFFIPIIIGRRCGLEVESTDLHQKGPVLLIYFPFFLFGAGAWRWQDCSFLLVKSCLKT